MSFIDCSSFVDVISMLFSNHSKFNTFGPYGHIKNWEVTFVSTRSSPFVAKACIHIYTQITLILVEVDQLKGKKSTLLFSVYALKLKFSDFVHIYIPIKIYNS